MFKRALPQLLLAVAPLALSGWALQHFVDHWSTALVAGLLWIWALTAAVVIVGGAMRSIEVPPLGALRLALRRMPTILTAVLILAVPVYGGFALARSAAGNPGMALAVFTVMPLIIAVLFGLFAPVIAAATLGGYTDMSALRQSMAIVRQRFLPNMGRVMFFVLVIPLLLLWMASSIAPVEAVMWVVVVIIQAVALARLYVTSPLVTLTTVDAQLQDLRFGAPRYTDSP